MRTYVIGRSREADIILTNASIAPRHAELVVSNHDDYYLTDCASGSGSWLQTGDSWTPLRQGFVTERHRIRFGTYETSLSQLISALRRGTRGQPSEGSGSAIANSAAMLAGTVERDPTTGEIVRKRT